MLPLTTTPELIKYSKKIDKNIKALKKSTVFNPAEKIAVLKIYSDLQTICKNRINHLLDLDQALKL